MRLRYLNLSLRAAARDCFDRPLDGEYKGRSTADAPARIPGRKACRSGALRLVRNQLELVGYSAEFGKRTRFHLLHRPGAMHLHAVASAMPISWVICLLRRPRAT
jgi:hypothetical protein